MSAISLRDHFAGLAMEALIPQVTTGGRPDRDILAERAYAVADAMLAEQAKGEALDEDEEFTTGGYVVVGKDGRASGAMMLRDARYLAERFDKDYPDDRPHNIHRLGPAVER